MSTAFRTFTNIDRRAVLNCTGQDGRCLPDLKVLSTAFFDTVDARSIKSLYRRLVTLDLSTRWSVECTAREDWRTDQQFRHGRISASAHVSSDCIISLTQ